MSGENSVKCVIGSQAVAKVAKRVKHIAKKGRLKKQQQPSSQPIGSQAPSDPMPS